MINRNWKKFIRVVADEKKRCTFKIYLYVNGHLRTITKDTLMLLDKQDNIEFYKERELQSFISLVNKRVSEYLFEGYGVEFITLKKVVKKKNGMSKKSK